MNNYNILYQKAAEIKEKLKKNMENVDYSINLNKKLLNECNVEIADLEREKNKKNHIYSTLVNYKSFIMEKLKLYIKVSGITAGVFAVILSIIGLIVSAPIADMLWALVGSLVLGTTVGVINFMDDTKEARFLHKNHKKRLYAFPYMIIGLDKKINIEHERANGYKENIDIFEDEKKSLSVDINKCEEIIKWLIDFIPDVAFRCRDDIETINEVYENDIEVEKAMKLLRELN